MANPDLVGMLLKAGADANVANEDAQTALMLAARTGNVAVAQLLVQNGAEVNRRESFRDQSAVMWAAGEGHADMVAFLVSKGADLSMRARATDWSKPDHQRTARAISPDRWPHSASVRRACRVHGLHESHARCRRRHGPAESRRHDADDDGARQRVSFGRALPARTGANPHTWDWWGRTPLYVAVTMRGGVDSRQGKRPPESLELIKALLEAGVNLNAQLAFKEPSRGGRDNRFRDDLLTTGATPLIRAAQTFDNEVVHALLEHGALVDLPNASGVTPFMAAAGIGTRTTAGVLGPGPFRERRRTLPGNDGDPADGRRRRERTNH